MEMLHVQDGRIVTTAGQPVTLKGYNIGGWLNMEDFIDGYPGAEHNLRATMARILGVEKAQFYFDRLLDYFFTEEDAACMAEMGANVLRLPFNYRHFERDEAPFEYLESGFARLGQAIQWCEKYGIYVVLDFHATPGWHNPDWHSDNANMLFLLWNTKHYQDRFIGLWKEIARRYRDNPVIAGYDLVNEPTTRLEFERYEPSYYDWDAINRLYRRAVGEIRAVDPDHIIFLEGDEFANAYDGLDVTFAPNLVVSTHNYTTPTVSLGDYPGEFGGMYWNRDILAAEFGAHSGTRLAFQHHLPVYSGEFGVWYAEDLSQTAQRCAALDDQLGVFASAGVHWTIWTWKDIAGMGTYNIDPESDFARIIQPYQQAKRAIASWGDDTPKSQAAATFQKFVNEVDEHLEQMGIPVKVERNRIGQYTMFGYLAQLLQVPYAQCFQHLSETEIDRILSAFALKNCVQNKTVAAVVSKHLQAG